MIIKKPAIKREKGGVVMCNKNNKYTNTGNRGTRPPAGKGPMPVKPATSQVHHGKHKS